MFANLTTQSSQAASVTKTLRFVSQKEISEYLFNIQVQVQELQDLQVIFAKVKATNYTLKA